jgi:hypothetical protein
MNSSETWRANELASLGVETRNVVTAFSEPGVWSNVRGFL